MGRAHLSLNRSASAAASKFLPVKFMTTKNVTVKILTTQHQPQVTSKFSSSQHSEVQNKVKNINENIFSSHETLVQNETNCSTTDMFKLGIVNQDNHENHVNETKIQPDITHNTTSSTEFVDFATNLNQSQCDFNKQISTDKNNFAPELSASSSDTQAEAIEISPSETDELASVNPREAYLEDQLSSENTTTTDYSRLSEAHKRSRNAGIGARRRAEFVQRFDDAASRGNIFEAQRCFEWARSNSDRLPNRFEYNLMLKACAIGGDVTGAVEWLKEMVVNKIEPSQRSFGKVEYIFFFSIYL